MKFQKGLLSEDEPAKPAGTAERQAIPGPTLASHKDAARMPNAAADSGHLFETLEEEESGSRKYIKVFGAVVVLVIVAAVLIGYFMLPGVGDKVRVPAGVELAVRDHFLTKEKRTATDIEFYQCDGYFGARVGVETRTDLPNPIFKLDTYSARVAKQGDSWEISATPLASGEKYTPCR